MRVLVERDPRTALALTLPAAVRAQLPATILAEVETRFSARGDFSVLVVDYSPAELARRRASGLSTEPFSHLVTLAGRDVAAFVYGRRSEQTTKQGLLLHGVMLDGVVALHESALRLIEPGESTPADAPPGGWRAELAGRWLGFALAEALLADEARPSPPRARKWARAKRRGPTPNSTNSRARSGRGGGSEFGRIENAGTSYHSAGQTV